MCRNTWVDFKEYVKEKFWFKLVNTYLVDNGCLYKFILLGAQVKEWSLNRNFFITSYIIGINLL